MRGWVTCRTVGVFIGRFDQNSAMLLVGLNGCHFGGSIKSTSLKFTRDTHSPALSERGHARCRLCTSRVSRTEARGCFVRLVMRGRAMACHNGGNERMRMKQAGG